MCGLIDDTFDFIKDSVGEIGKHPLAALGAAAGVPGFDPFFGGLFNKDALISPTGNFTSSAWNDMYQSNPGDSNALGLFHSVNDVADKVAPAIAGAYAFPGAGEAAGAGANAGGAFTLDGTQAAGAGAADLGGLEAGAGGAALFGPTAGTGLAIGDAAGGLGGGGLGIAGGSSLGGVLGNTTSAAGTGLGLGTGNEGGLNAAMNAAAPTPTGTPAGDALSGTNVLSQEGSQMPGQGLGPNAFESGAAGGGEQGGGDLSALYGPTGAGGPTPSGAAYPGSGTLASGSPTGSAVAQSTGGVSPAVTAPQGSSMFSDDNLKTMFDLAKSGYGAYQQYAKQQANNNYTNSIRDIFSPNGAYAQQMQHTLAAKDAAAGRNSQYGQRSVQLAAALADAQSRALGNSSYAGAATATPGASLFNSLFSNFSSPSAMRGLYGLGQQAYQGAANYGGQALQGLSGLFGG